jgi:hypothetical protein
VIRKFVATGPTVQAPTRKVTLDVTPEKYYQDPASHAQRLYQDF